MSKINMPTGFGGLQRFDEEYASKLRLSATQVIIFIVALIAFVVALNIFWPVG